MLQTNANKCAKRMWMTLAMTWLELNMYCGGRIAADELRRMNLAEQMCLTNAIDVSYDMTSAQHVIWRTHCCRRTSTNEFRWANVLNECEQMCLTNVNKCAWRMRLTVAMTWLELNMYFGTVGVYQQVLASICTHTYIYIYAHMLHTMLIYSIHTHTESDVYIYIYIYILHT